MRCALRHAPLVSAPIARRLSKHTDRQLGVCEGAVLPRLFGLRSLLRLRRGR